MNWVPASGVTCRPLAGLAGLGLRSRSTAFLTASHPADIFVRALVVAVAVALLGAAYAAFRAVRLTPMEALRYE